MSSELLGNALVVSSVPQAEILHPDWRNLKTITTEKIPDIYDVHFLAYDDFSYIADGQATRIFHRETKRDATDFDLMISRWEGTEADKATALAHYAMHHDVQLLSPHLLTLSRGKLATAFILALADIPTPKTIHTALEHFADLAEDELDYPFVLQDVAGTRGRANYLVRAPEDLHARLNDHTENTMIAREYIPNDADYRVLLLNGVARVVQYRPSGPQTHLNIVGNDGRRKSMSPDDNSIKDGIIADAERSAAARNLLIASVDVVVDKRTLQHYVLDVNDCPDIASEAIDHPNEEVALADCLAFADMITSLLDLRSKDI